MHWIAIVVVGCLAAASVGYLYWLHSPSPSRPALSGTVETKEFDLGGNRRRSMQYIPRAIPLNAPMLLVLHGTGQTGAKIRQWTGYEFDAMADRHGFVVAYPDGYKGGWNDCRKQGSTPAKAQNIDDVGFLRAVIERSQQEQGVDGRRVFVTGYSNGAQMGFRLIAEAPGAVAGLAVAGAKSARPREFRVHVLRQFSSCDDRQWDQGSHQPVRPRGGLHLWFQ